MLWLLITLNHNSTLIGHWHKFNHWHHSHTQGGDRIKITDRAGISQPLPGVSPVYYSSSCSVSVSVSELGEGTHSFQGYIYPDVTGGGTLVNAIEPSKTVTLCEYIEFGLSILAFTMSCVSSYKSNVSLMSINLFFYADVSRAVTWVNVIEPSEW